MAHARKERREGATWERVYGGGAAGCRLAGRRQRMVSHVEYPQANDLVHTSRRRAILQARPGRGELGGGWGRASLRHARKMCTSPVE
eukprot:3874014-Pyramimonas_sp.AAC.1